LPWPHTLEKGKTREAMEIHRDAIFQDMVKILADMTGDWDTEFDGPMGPETRLVADLGFESIDIVQLIVAIEERYKRRGFPFEELLMSDGRYVDEIKLGNVVAFLHQHLNKA